jgi:hypothetical protein
MTRQGKRVTLFIDGLPEATFSADPPASPTVPFKISSPGQPFRGTIGELAIYGRAFPRDEILGRYKRDAAAYGKDTAMMATLTDHLWNFDEVFDADLDKTGIASA